ncbi:hypothetical protein GEMRC1_009459 [Eukaryota sp. GEM-RC1]
MFFPDSVATSSPPSPCSIPPSSQIIQIQESLVSLISSHMLTNLWNTFPTYNQQPHSRHHRLTNKLPAFIQQVGYVSHRFYVAAFLGVKMFFESNILSADAYYDLPFLLPTACYFQADVPSVALIVDPYCKVEKLLDHTLRITSLKVIYDVTNLTHLLDSSSTLFLPRLRSIDFTTRSDSKLTSFCEALLLSTTIVELSITPKNGFSSDIHTFKKVKLVSFEYWDDEDDDDDELESLVTALMTNTKLESIELNLPYGNLNLMAPLLAMPGLQTIVVPRGDYYDGHPFPSVFDALRNNSSLQQITFAHSVIDTEEISNILNYNSSVKKLDIIQCSFTYFHNFLEANSSLLVLSLSQRQGSKKPKNLYNGLMDMIQTNTSLIVLNLDVSCLRYLQFQELLKALEANSTLRKVSFPGIRLKLTSLITVFEILSPLKLLSTADISPYYIDTKKGVFCYSPQELVRLTSDEVSLLQSFVESFTIKHLTLKECRFTENAINALCDLIRVNNSLISVDFSSCRLYPEDTMLIIHALEANSGLNEVFLKNSSLEFNALLLIFKCITSHQSPIFFHVSRFSVELSVGTIFLLLETLKSNVPIKRVVCPGLNRPSLKTCLTLLEIHSLNKSVISFDCFPHCIDLDNGIVGFSPNKSIPVSVEEVSSLQNLLAVFNIKELSLKNWRFSNDAITKLSDLIRLSTSLTSVDFNCCNLSPEQVFTLIGAFKSNSCLKTVDISNCGTNLNNLLEIFQLSLTEELLPNIQCSPHVIDISCGCIRYEHHLTSADLVSLLNALKSSVPVKRVDYRGLNNSKFSDLLVILEILSINTSVIDFDVSPHLLDIENGVFSFSPKKTVTLTFEEIFSLSSFLQSFIMKEIHLIKCNFVNTTITHLCDLIENNNSLTSFDFSKIRISAQHFSYLLESLSSKTSIRHLNLSYPILEGISQSTHDTIVTKLCDLIRVNNSLTYVDFSSWKFSPDHLSSLISALKANSSLTTLNVSKIDFNLANLLAIFELVSVGNNLQNLDVSPHLINLSTGVVRYEKELDGSDLVSLLKALKLHRCVEFVEYRRSKTLSFEGLMALFEILSMKKDLLEIHTSPHSFDIEKRFFCFSGENTEISSKQLLSLQVFLERFNINNLILTNCRFTEEAITVLADLIKSNSSLTSVDFSYCYFSPDHLYSLIGALKSNSCLKTLNLSQNDINFANLLAIFELVSVVNNLQNVDVSPHSIDLSAGVLRYENQLDGSDLILLLKAWKSKCRLNFVECRGLKTLCLEELMVSYEILSMKKDLLEIDTSPHSFDVEKCFFCFSGENTEISSTQMLSLQVFLERFNINNLILTNCRFTEEAITVLADLIKSNNSLTSIDFSYCYFSHDHLSSLISALKANSCLKTLNLSKNDINFANLLAIFELVSVRNNLQSVNVSPHSIDLSAGVLRYENQLDGSDLILLLKALKLKCRLNFVECRGLKTLCLEELMVSYEILSMKKDLLEIDTSPHSFDVEKCFFCFSGENTEISSTQMLSIQVFLERFNINNLILTNCRFTEEAITVLADLIKSNSSLTSVDFSYCKFSHENVIVLLNAIKINSALKFVNLTHVPIILDNLLPLLNSAEPGVPIIQVSPHCVSRTSGELSFSLLSLVQNFESMRVLEDS